MKCSKCNTDMTKGVLVSHGQFWQEPFNGPLKFLAFMGIKGREVSAYRCVSCGKLELVTAI